MWVLDLVSQYCGRALVQDGYYQPVTKGISLGCPLSPLMGALYLSLLDSVIDALPGIRYVRFMDNWDILAKTRWQLRRAVRVMNRGLAQLGLEQHPDKTFIGPSTAVGSTPLPSPQARPLSHHSSTSAIRAGGAF